MDDLGKEHEALEHILIDANVEPIMLSYAFLKNITNNFSQMIGRGGFGEVYMGTLRNGKVAVKKLSNTNDFSEKQFEDELLCLIKVKHNNIVRVLGYCSDTSRQVVDYNGKIVLADVRRRLLCFEYVPNKNLQYYLKDESHGCEWDTRYQLIYGICQGLHYLHIKEQIYHLDLKPENILLDADMVPKITDFGLSRRFSGEKSRIITENICGTPGYIAPEYLNKGEISFKSDIYSLGIIIMKILSGSNDLPDSRSWHKSSDMDRIKVKRWVNIAQLCVDVDQHKRPTIDHIIGMLNDEKEIEIETVPPVGNLTKSSVCSLEQVSSGSIHLPGMEHVKLNLAAESVGVSAGPFQQQRKISVETGPTETSTEIRTPGFYEDTSKLLGVHPVELHFPFELNKLITSPVSLTNRTRHHVGAWITPTTGFGSCFQCSPSFGIVEPHSTWVVTITMKKQHQKPPPSGKDTDKFEVLMIVMRSEQEVQLLKSPIGSMLNMNSEFLNRVEGLGGKSKMHRVILTAVIGDPTSCPEVASHQVRGVDLGHNLREGTPQPQEQIKPGSPTTKMLDVHPLELRFPWEPSQRIGCPVSLTNRTDHYVGVWITPTCLDSTRFDFLFPVSKWSQTVESPCSPLFHIMKPHSTWIVSAVTMKKQPRPELRDDDKLAEVLMVAMASIKDIENLKRSMGNNLNIDDKLLKRIKLRGKVVHRTMLSAVICDCDPASQEILNHQMISTNEFGSVYSLDMHPSETWMLTGHRRGYVSIWNYETQERVMALQVFKEPGKVSSFFMRSSATRCIYTAKFISQNQWFAIGDDYGCINIYNYTTKDKVEGFEAHHGKPINSLAAHPTYPFLLSSSHLDSFIKLWDWDQGWLCTRTFDVHASGVLHLTFNPRDINIFASVNTDGTAKVWDINSSRLITKLTGSRSVDFLFNVSHRDFLVTCGLQTNMCAEIWDLQTKECVHTFSMDKQGIYICDLACHPTLPIFVTTFIDGTVCLWDATTYRLEKMVHISGCLDHSMQFFGTKDLTRLMVGYDEGVAIWKLIHNCKDGPVHW